MDHYISGLQETRTAKSAIVFMSPSRHPLLKNQAENVGRNLSMAVCFSFTYALLMSSIVVSYIYFLKAMKNPK